MKVGLHIRTLAEIVASPLLLGEIAFSSRIFSFLLFFFFDFLYDFIDHRQPFRLRQFGQRLQTVLQMHRFDMYTTRALVACARRAGIELPISEGVHAILYEGAVLQDVIDGLLFRDPKPE